MTVAAYLNLIGSYCWYVNVSLTSSSTRSLPFFTTSLSHQLQLRLLHVGSKCARPTCLFVVVVVVVVVFGFGLVVVAVVVVMVVVMVVVV